MKKSRVLSLLLAVCMILSSSWNVAMAIGNDTNSGAEASAASALDSQTVKALKAEINELYASDPGDLGRLHKMQAFIMELALHAKTKNPDFKIIPQDGINLAFEDGDWTKGVQKSLISLVDGWGIEGMVGTASSLTPSTTQQKYIKLVEEGLYVSDTTVCSTQAQLDNYYARANAWGIVPYPRIAGALSESVFPGWRWAQNGDYFWVEDPVKIGLGSRIDGARNVTKLTDAKSYLYNINGRPYDAWDTWDAEEAAVVADGDDGDRARIFDSYGCGLLVPSEGGQYKPVAGEDGNATGVANAITLYGNEWDWWWREAGLAANAGRETWLAALRNSDYDVIYIDSFYNHRAKPENQTPLTKAEIESLKVKPDGGRRQIIAYLSIGSAEQNRWYCQDDWVWIDPSNPNTYRSMKAGRVSGSNYTPPQDGAPAWLAMGYGGNYPEEAIVQWWNPEWRKIIINGSSKYAHKTTGDNTSSIDRIIAQGFDGVYLDNVGVYSRSQWNAFENYWLANGGIPGMEDEQDQAPLVLQDLDYTENPVDIPNPDRGFERGNDDAAGSGPYSSLTSGSNKWGYMTIPASEDTILGYDFELYYEMTPPYYLGGNAISTTMPDKGIEATPNIVQFYLVLNNFSSNAWCESTYGTPSAHTRVGEDGPITAYGLNYIKEQLEFIRSNTNSVAHIRVCYDPKGWNHIVWNADNLIYEDGARVDNYYQRADYTKPVAPEDRAAHIAKPGAGTWRGSSPIFRMCTVPGYTDMNWVQYHYAQLKPLFQEYSDVIWAFDSGTFGPWGESHSNYEAEVPGNYKIILDSLLDAVPDGKPIMTHVGGFLDWYNRTYNTTYSFGNLDTFPAPVRGTPEARFGMFDDSNGYSEDEYSYGDNGSLTEGYRMLAHDPILPGYNPEGIDPSLTRDEATAPGGKVSSVIGYNDSGVNRLAVVPETLGDARWRGVWFPDWDRTKMMTFLGKMSVYGGEQIGNTPALINGELNNGGYVPVGERNGNPLNNVIARWPSLFYEHSISNWTYMCIEQGRGGFLNRINAGEIYNKENVAVEITYPWSGQKVQVLYDPVYEGKTMLEYYRDRMGYRFVLREAYASDWVTQDSALEYKGKIQNVGWGEIFNKKNVSVILKDKDTGETYKALTDIDPYDWKPAAAGESNSPLEFGAMPDSRATNTAAWRDLNFSIDMDEFGEVPPGDYEIYLKINDPKETTVNKRSIRFANKGDIWDEDLGANLIGSTTVYGELPPLVPQDLNYAENPVDIPNPDRGFYRPQSYVIPVNGGTPGFPNLSATITGTSVAVNARIVYMEFDLRNFSSNAPTNRRPLGPWSAVGALAPDYGTTQPLTTEALAYVRAALQRVRDSEAVAIVKFSYDGQGYTFIDSGIWDRVVHDPEPGAPRGRQWYETSTFVEVTDRPPQGIGIYDEAPWELQGGTINEDDSCGIPGHEDKNWVEYHLWQLGSVFTEYEDVIMAVKGGIFGAWGEMHSSSYAQTAEGYHWLINAYMDYLPASRSILAHAGGAIAWQNVEYGTNYSFTNLPPAPARGSKAQRIGMFNDSYSRGGDGEYNDNGSLSEGYNLIGSGEFADFDRNAVLTWIRNQNNFYGGETVGSNASNIYTNFRNVAYEAAYAQSTHLNTSYSSGTYSLWGNFTYNEANITEPYTPPHDNVTRTAIFDPLYNGRNGMEYMRDRLGFRLVLREANASEWVEQDGTLMFSGKIQNVGFGNVVNKKNVSVILKATDGSQTYTALTNLDARDWKPDLDSRANNTDAWRDLGFAIELDAFGTVAPGDYDIYLKINDPKETTANKRSIRFANYDIWNADLGANLIGSTTVPAPVIDALYVAPDGDNATGDGSIDKPWKTVQYGVSQLIPGDTLIIREGVYNERVTVGVSGTNAADGLITIKGEDGKRVILDGTGLKSSNGSDHHMILLSNKNYVRIENLEICNNYSPNNNWAVNTGIYVESSSNGGGSTGIQIVNNKVYNIDGETYHTQSSNSGAHNGHGIAVFGHGNTEARAVSNLLIDGNEVYYCKLGQSEAVVVNGNVKDWKIINNYVHDNSNIGIDAIGGEGECSVEALDVARNGLIAGNVVINNTGHGNQTYNNGGGADGIYVDGGKDIVIENNYVIGSDYGIEVATENESGFAPTGISILNNVVSYSANGGILFGGTNGAGDAIIEGNTIFTTGTALSLSRGKELTIQNNIIISNGSSPVSGGTNVTTLSYGTGNIYYRNGSGSISKPAADTNGAVVTTLPVASLTSGDFTPADGVTKGALPSSEKTPALAKAIANYAARVAILPTQSSVYSTLNSTAVKGTSSNPLTMSKIGENICRYFEGLEGVAGTGAKVYMKHANNSESSFRDNDNQYKYYGIVTIGKGADGQINYDKITQVRAFTNMRIYVSVPYEANGQISWIDQQVSSICVTFDPNDIPVPGYYVSPTGSNTAGDGSFKNPWATIQYGVNNMPAGETLYIREGTYSEAVSIAANRSGSAAGHTVIAAYPGETPVITGTSGSRISLTNVQYITIDGLTLDGGSYGINYSTNSSRPVAGLDNVFILNNTIRNINGNNSICVYNQNSVATTSLRNVQVKGNNVYGGRSGSTETVVLNGNIDGFEVSGNLIHNNNNIGIDLIGYEGGVSEYNRTRNGKVFDNMIYGTTVINNTNSDYWNNWDTPAPKPFGGIYDRCSDGIYVDGGKDIEIYHNYIFDNDIGIEVASERSVNATTMNTTVVTGVSVHDNIIASTNGWAGICFGGYDGNLAYTKDCEIYNNILYGNMIGIGVQKSKDNLIKDNIIMGGEIAVEFMPFMERNPASGDPFTTAALPGANKFEGNVWFNSDDSDDFFTDLKKLQTVAPEQWAKQLFPEDSPLAAPENGNFTVAEAYAGYGTAWKPAQAMLDLYVQYTVARAELLEARDYLESVKFDFMAALEEGNLNRYLTSLLKQAGYENSEVLYVTRTASTSATTGQGLNDPTGNNQIVTLSIGASNGNINATNLNNVFNGLADGASKEYAYIVQVITRYGDNSYTSEATESDGGGVRMVVSKAPAVNISITSPVGKIVAGYAANLPADVTITGGTVDFTLGLYGPDGGLIDTISVSDSGRYTFKLATTDTVAAGAYVIKAVGAASGVSIECVEQPADLWAPVPVSAENSITITFASDVTFNETKKGAKIDAVTVNSSNISASGKVVTITDVAASQGQSLVLSGVKYADLFPSYSFTFTLSIK